MDLIAKEAFSWAHRGCDVEAFTPGQVIKTEDQDLIAVATAEGWAEPADQKKAKEERSTKSKGDAPENK